MAEEERVVMVGRVSWTAAWRRSSSSRCWRWDMIDWLEGRVKRRFNGRDGSAEEEEEEEAEEEEAVPIRGAVVMGDADVVVCCRDCCMMEAMEAREGGLSKE